MELGDREDTEDEVPDTLYHGTARHNVESIREKGVVPKGRQEVYLSGTVEEAVEVGTRHGEPVVFEVDTEDLDVERRGKGVYTVERVPSDFLSVVEGVGEGGT